MLKLLEKRDDIKKVNIIIDEPPEGKRGKRFSRLSDGVTRRKYAIGQVTMMDGRECSLIDVEREDRALSILILKVKKLVNWKRIYSILLLGLVEESGKWDSEEIEGIKQKGIVVIRKKHTKKTSQFI